MKYYRACLRVLLPMGSAQAVMFRAALLFVVHFPVIKYKCHSHLKYGELVGPDDAVFLKYRYRFWKPRY